jgi:hypothetical protein
MSFVVPIHAVDLELEKPDRFYVQDVWEVADEPTEDVVAGLEGANCRDCCPGSNCHAELWWTFSALFTRLFRTHINSSTELEGKLLESPTAWANICTNAVFDKLYSVTK